MKVVCKQCNKEFNIYPARVLIQGKGKYCSKICYTESMKLGDKKKSRKDINRDYRLKNRDKCAVWKHKRRTLENNLGGNFTEKEWKDLKIKYNNKCAKCLLIKKLTVDHIIPISKWKDWSDINKPNYKCNDIENIQPLCGSCNSSKNDKL